MTTMSVQLPSSLAKISRRIPAEVLAEGVSYAIKKRINEEKKLLKQAEKKIQGFGKRYKSSYQTFLHKVPSKKQAEAHQDWVEWSFWEKVHDQAKTDLSLFSKIYQLANR